MLRPNNAEQGKSSVDGPCASHFSPVLVRGNCEFNDLPSMGLSQEMCAASSHASVGECVSWGIPFRVTRCIVLKDKEVSIEVDLVESQWLVFMHTSDKRPFEWNESGFVSPARGFGHLAEHAADYVVIYEDSSEITFPIRRRYEIGSYQRIWGEHNFASVTHRKPRPVRANHEQPSPYWGRSQWRTDAVDMGPWINWLCAWPNPFPEKRITNIKFVPKTGTVIVFGLAHGHASSHPLRWNSRKKAVLKLPEGEAFNPGLDEMGLLDQIRVDMGHIISAVPRLEYPRENWSESYDNQLPKVLTNEVVVEYTAHPDAFFHLWNGRTIAVRSLEEQCVVELDSTTLEVVNPAAQKVTIRVVEKNSGKMVSAKLHLHGEAGEYLSPKDRSRIPNPAVLEDTSVDFTHEGIHHCTYIPGETIIDLPLGRIYIEISKGFEIKPLRKTFEISPATSEIDIQLEKILPWREKGWVSADPHVHIISPSSALLEGSGEGVNVVNLLTTQWGEWMPNAGDFDGKTTLGSKEAGGDGEYLVRVGTEHRQHVLGHISLLGYSGSPILPLSTGGPMESALGDPIECLLTEWARKCKKQGGLVVVPHFPDPRGEHAAAIVCGEVDAIEMTHVKQFAYAQGDLYGGINPYSLSDWYRYLNCGYALPAVGGTDKMTAATAVGTIRTYTKLDTSGAFDYQTWMDAVRKGETFVTYGPLLEFSVEGKPIGSKFQMPATGGTVHVEWEVASVTIPMSKVDLVVNGEIRESVSVESNKGSGQWSVNIDRSSWLALMVRGHYPDKPEIIAAHSSAIMVKVDGSEFYAEADALTILEQIEGSMAYLDTIGTRAEISAYKRMRLVLESAHRTLHNRMHSMGFFHKKIITTDHAKHK